MAPPRPSPAARLLREYGWDLLLGSIAAFYAVMVPYTKVEESFNVQAMHDILYHNYHIEKYDHLEFPGVVPRSFIGALVVSVISSPAVFIMHLFHIPKVYGLLAVRMMLGSITLITLRLIRVQVKNKFGHHAEAFYVMLTATQFHLLFYSTRPLPNILALAFVNLTYYFWFKGNYLRTLQALIVAAVIFRCDMILLLGTIGLALLLSRSISLLEAVKCCVSTAIICIGFTVLVDSIMWRRILWPEFEVLWFNSVLNRSSEWGTHPIHWYFTSALPRSMLVAYPLSVVGASLDRRIVKYILPVFLFVILYSKLPHKELRFIIASIPMLNVSASLAASRVYNNRKKAGWKLLYVLMIGGFLASLGYSSVTFMASYNNYPGGYALKALHEADSLMKEKTVHIDAFTAMSGVSRFCESEYPWRYSKEEEISIEEYQERNFTYLLNEHRHISGYKCLFAVDGFSRAKIQPRIPPLSLVKEPKVFAHGNTRDPDILSLNWPGCP
ncbi:dol-P-Man:Man(7)GlcNAc(2)-PP-Dol alpha-1,6-mannosyltransferase isoform X2 [Oryza brachyantha]|uniref:dol-P-Man:Man(7)GlcNAc(2)-PP-Dol alpha-1,6-mannosyltransferase isoform X2 n=1 Tax=Oryza brachyantha TaxID=4533 RepID=UPI000776161C|nr:dol-P-Man:Man(7)GlcNAc(2)-PP-Dol alpha-1,6-mannosyltransferase isoform X2 [Oryza brachyantha]